MWPLPQSAFPVLYPSLEKEHPQIFSQNRVVTKICKRAVGRMISFGGQDPARGP